MLVAWILKEAVSSLCWVICHSQPLCLIVKTIFLFIMYLSLSLSLSTHTHTHTHNHKLLHCSHATAAIMTSSLAGVQMVTGVTGMHKCHYILHFLSTATLISAHWHMDDVNHDIMQYATCVVCILWSFYHSWAPLCTVCLEHTGQCALVSWLLRNMLPHLRAQCTSESKCNIFQQRITMESLCMNFSLCVCVFRGEGGIFLSTCSRWP